MRAAHVLILALSISRLACSQSFDCKLAQSPREHAVCSDKELAADDSAVSGAFQSLRAQLSPESAALVRSDERKWLQWLDVVCPARGKGIADDMNRCLANEYRNRTRDLQRVAYIRSTVIFLRSRFLYKARSSKEEDAGGNDPGFDYGTLRWPQIDIHPSRTNGAFTAFNAAVSEFVVGADFKKQNSTLATGVEAAGTVDGFYTVKAANDRFIDVMIFDMNYSWGAAHPNTSNISFLWWLDRNRELAISDVFIPSGDWQDKVTALAVKNLRSQPDIQEMLGDKIDETVKETVSNPTHWTLTRDGLLITFGQYAIGPYALGMPEAQISWTDLKPYLAPELKPETLPAPVSNEYPWVLSEKSLGKSEVTSSAFGR